MYFRLTFPLSYNICRCILILNFELRADCTRRRFRACRYTADPTLLCELACERIDWSG